MKKPFIAEYGEEVKLEKREVYYDFKAQLSYVDKDYSKKVIEGAGLKSETTRKTFTVEDSDEDERVLFDSTKKTATMESTDEDEMVFIEQTRLTETIENSDEDEMTLFCSTKQTRSIESSDEDEMLMQTVNGFMN